MGKLVWWPFDIEGLAVNEADADAFVVGVTGRQRLCQVRLTSVGRARAREHRGVLAERQLPARAVHDVHVAGQSGSERVVAVIDGPRVERVVVAGQQHYRALPVTALKLLQDAVPPLLIRSRLIEQVARAEHGIDGAAVGQVQNAADDVKAGSGQPQFLFGAERGEAAAEVPVGGVQQRQRHVVLLHVLLRMETRWRILGSVCRVVHSMMNSAVSKRSVFGRWKRRRCASSCQRV